MTVSLRLLCATYVFVATLVAPVSAKESGTSTTETDFRRRAAAFKKLRRLSKHDAAWDRRFEEAVTWFASNSEIIADGHRTCAEVRRRLGPPDPSSASDKDARSAEESIEYSSAACDAIGCGRIKLIIGCDRGKATAVALDLKAR